MKIDLKDIVNKHENKRAFIAMLGTSLNEVLPDLEKMSKDKNNDDIFISCNLYSQMCDIHTDYFIVTNNQPVMSLESAYEIYNKTNSTLVFSSRIKGFSIDSANKHLTCDWVAINDFLNAKDSLQDCFKEYTEGEVYGSVLTVLCHTIALGVVAGSKEIYIAGADLDYSKGYVKEKAHPSGVSLGKRIMNDKAKKDTINQINKIKKSAENKGVKIYCLNESSPLCEILEHKKIDDIK